MIKVRNWNDLIFGSFLIIVGLVGFYAARTLPVGNLLRMGPGWVPNATCWLLLFFGVLVIGRGLLLGQKLLQGWKVRPTIFILASVAFFALSIEHLGLPIAVFGTVVLAALADHELRLIEAIGLAIFLAAGTTLLFVEGLGLVIRIWPVWLH